MSEFFRTRAPADFAAKTLGELARLSHEAEESADDVLLMQCADEVARRDAGRRFRELYIAQWHERVAAKESRAERRKAARTGS